MLKDVVAKYRGYFLYDLIEELLTRYEEKIEEINPSDIQLIILK